ncbi:MAG: helix-turn-helix domain-containing protein [Syntrophomonadaceae bacterium]|nr:helix-turn-helix domain-containing protein [Syntrophomonadaceae bacterium]
MQEYMWLAPWLTDEERPMTDKQLRVLLAAVKLFSEQGYAATSTREIAQLAEVSEATIFKHYSTKKEFMLGLCRLLLERVVQPLISTGLDQLMDRPYDSLNAFLEALMENRMGLVERALPVVRLLIQEMPFNPELRLMLAEAAAHFPLAAMFDTLKGQGLMVDWPTEELIKLTVPSLIGFMISHFVLLPELLADDMEGEIDRYINFLARALGK